jgi:hypothetical protein
MMTEFDLDDVTSNMFIESTIVADFGLSNNEHKLDARRRLEEKLEEARLLRSLSEDEYYT